MPDLIYKNEKPLFAIAAVLAAIFWLAVLYFSKGLVLIYVVIAWLFYLFAQSGFIAWIKGNGVEVTPEQFPDLYQHFDGCCQKLGVEKKPRLYLMNGEGMLNALATKFLRTEYVVLFSSIVDALERKPSLVKFYMGHELAHLKRKHLTWAPLLLPVLWLPLLGAAYSRAREYSCDRHGLACADSAADASFAMAVLAAGERRWSEVKFPAYQQQLDDTRGFWMSFHELCADYPWLSKRVARLLGSNEGAAGNIPRRNAFAYLFALVVPRTGMGPAGPLVIIAVIAVLAAVAIPAYRNFMQRSELAAMPASDDSQHADYDNNTDYGYRDESEASDHYATTSDAENDASLANALTGMQIVSAAYIDAFQTNPSQQIALPMMNLSEDELLAMGIISVEFSEFAMTAWLNAIDANTGDYHYVRIAGAHETDGNGMYAQCSDSSLSVEQLAGICR